MIITQESSSNDV